MQARRIGLCWTHEFSQRYRTNPKFRENRNRTKRRYNRALLRRYRDKIAEALGGWVCVECGVTEKEKEVLGFDHKNGGGEEERKRMGGQGPTIRYYFHNIEAAKEHLQVLCANCNWKKNALERYGRTQSKTARMERKTREVLINLLGGPKCSRCGLTDISVLTLDHVGGGGSQERRLFGGYGPMIYYYLAHLDLAREKFQILCRNCNWMNYVTRTRRQASD